MTEKQMWSEFIEKFPEYKDEEYTSWHFCNDEKNANELAELVLKGEKTATASALFIYRFEKEDLPKRNELSIILNWNKEAQCIIKTTNVYLRSFDKVSVEHAYKEGEDDKSLENWRKEHKKYFTQELKLYGIEFSEDMGIVCEEFEVIWK
ncbi:MAG: ASCH domain-containing protein [Peptostreptococcaceae bacterium]